MKCIYSGSFDVLTKGHKFVIDKALKMFDEVYIAIGVNPDKKTLFSLDKRKQMISETFKNNPRIKVVSFENKFMAKFCKELDINFSIRGVRSVKDYEYELQLQEINEVINSDLTTIYLFPPAKYAGLSSSLVKGLVGNEGWEEIVKNMVPENVLKELDKLKK